MILLKVHGRGLRVMGSQDFHYWNSMALLVVRAEFTSGLALWVGNEHTWARVMC